ncbi:MAG: hypothetical protein LBH43_21240 [Treponema sp.]|jgi:hypothetical protein|nr:hypothetical protein [Treponema sp.]
MASQNSELEVIPIKEVKQQVDKNSVDGVYFRDPEIDDSKIHSTTWSKYPCTERESCSLGYCKGIITIIMSVDNIRWFSRPITLVAIRSKKKTYILSDRQFRKLQEYEVFAHCKAKSIQY